jgi:NO-binding membrane sensor protein with MHYT domain/DNA-binding LytR/AlgR family response regulator
MVVTHDAWVVALSVLVAIQGAYVGLKLALELRGSSGGRRRLLLASAAVTLAVAIWSMHFVGMLAVRAPVRIDYLVLPTLFSFLVCVVVVGFGVYLASSAPASKAVLALAAVVMGSGIVIMHFIGMLALHANAMMHHHPLHVALSLVVGVFASGLALFFAFEGIVRPPLGAASIALGLAIAGMHYTAMAGMTLHPMSGAVPTEATALSRDLLAVIVAIVAFGSTSAFLLALVPDGAPDLSRIWPYGPPARPPGVALAGSAGAALPDAAPAASAEPAVGHTAPAGPVPGPAAAEAWADVHAPAGVAAPPKPAAVIPVQKDGATHYLPVGRVHAVKAEAHYTTVFDGIHKFFCGLSITDVEARLDQTRFVRVHRSHIVAVDRIASLKRSGDGGVAELGSATPYSLPVSRRKLSELRALLDARA